MSSTVRKGRLICYTGAEHGEATLDEATALDYFSRVIAWFDKYLKAPEKTEGTRQ